MEERERKIVVPVLMEITIVEPKPWPVAEFLTLMYVFLGFLALFGLAVIYR